MGENESYRSKQWANGDSMSQTDEEAIEDELDLQMAEEALEKGEFVSWEKLKAELGIA